MADLAAALNTMFPNLNKSAAAVTNRIREVKGIFTLYCDAKQSAMNSGCPSDEVLVFVFLNIPLFLDLNCFFIYKVLDLKSAAHDGALLMRS